MFKSFVYLTLKNYFSSILKFLYGIFYFISEFFHSKPFSTPSQTMSSSSIGYYHALLSKKTFLRKNIIQILLYFTGYLSSLYLYKIYTEPQSLIKYITSIFFPFQVQSIQNISLNIISILIILLLIYLWSIMTQHLKFLLYSISLILFIIALTIYIILFIIEIENIDNINILLNFKIETINNVFNGYLTKYYPAIVHNYPETLEPLYFYVLSQFTSHQWELTTLIELYKFLTKEIQMYLDLNFEITIDENSIQHATKKPSIEPFNSKDLFWIFYIFVGYIFLFLL
jgi:hypothetical protein